MISSLVPDANRDAFFPEIAKDIRSWTSQSERAFNTIHFFSIYYNLEYLVKIQLDSDSQTDT